MPKGQIDPEAAKKRALIEELREATQEAHQALGALAEERKKCENLVETAAPRLVKALDDLHEGWVAQRVEESLQDYQNVLAEIQEKHVKEILEGFDEMVAKLTFATTQDKRRGMPSMGELIDSLSTDPTAQAYVDPDVLRAKIAELDHESEVARRTASHEARKEAKEREAKSQARRKAKRARKGRR